MSKKTKIIIVVVIILVAGGLFAWKTLSWQGKVAGIKETLTSMFGGEESQLPENIKAAYDKIKEDPTNVDSYITIARWKTDKEQFEDAIKIYKAALQFRPTDTLLWNNLADIYIKNKRYAEAEEAYLKITENNPGWVQAYRSLVDLYRYQIPEKRGDIPKLLEDGMARNLEYMKIHFVQLLAVYYRDFGPKEEAIKWYEELVKLDPENETVKAELVEIKKRGMSNQ
jgi:tetratricopeptide (TPR) repeat protein